MGHGLGLWLSSGHLLLLGVRGWVRVKILGYGFGLRGRKVKQSHVTARWRVI